MQMQGRADSVARPLLSRFRIVSQAKMHNSPWMVKCKWILRRGVSWTIRRKVLAVPDLTKIVIRPQ